MIDDFRGSGHFEEELEAADERYMTFWVDQKLCGLPIAHVVQILQMQPITPVPQYPSYAKGVIDLRGQIIPVIDLGLRFGKEPKEYDNRTCILVHQYQSLPVGLIVERIGRVLTVPESGIQSSPDTASDHDWAFSWGQGHAGQQEVLLLDIDKVLTATQEQSA